MQVLKPEIRSRILENAETLFFQSGYAGLSTRDLARLVGVSHSNLYKYFENKADLFEAVMGEYAARLTARFEGFLAHDEREFSAERHIDGLGEVLFELIRADRKKFLILFEGSAGTRFAPARDQVTEMIEARIRERLGAKAAPVELRHVIAENFFLGIIRLARTVEDQEVLRQCLQSWTAYHLGGVDQLGER